MGSQCNWSGPREEMILIEWMPPYLRESHRAAGNAGVYPHNGSVRALVEWSCGQTLLDAEPDWAREVEA